MIPKIAHFHWEGKPINWMRMMSMYTFARLNPRWEIRLLRTPDKIRAKKLPMYANEADWVWLEALQEHGGFAMATDTVFVRPIPEEWTDADFCACRRDNMHEFYHCCFGAAPGNVLVNECVDFCQGMEVSDLACQDMGILLLNSVVKNHGGFPALIRYGMEFCDMSQSSVTPITSAHPERCWFGDDIQIPDDTVAVTWFGGHESSRKCEPLTTPDSDYPIVKLVHQVLNGEIE